MNDRMEPTPGFYCGNKAFEIFVEITSEQPDGNKMTHNGLLFIRCPFNEDYVISGVGEPYSSMAKDLEKRLKLNR